MVLAVYAGEQHMPGDFFRILLTAMAHADQSNMAAFERGWPNLGRALRMYKNDDGGAAILRQERDVPNGST